MLVGADAADLDRAKPYLAPIGDVSEMPDNDEGRMIEIVLRPR